MRIGVSLEFLHGHIEIHCPFAVGKRGGGPFADEERILCRVLLLVHNKYFGPGTRCAVSGRQRKRDFVAGFCAIGYLNADSASIFVFLPQDGFAPYFSAAEFGRQGVCRRKRGGGGVAH